MHLIKLCVFYGLWCIVVVNQQTQTNQKYTYVTIYKVMFDIRIYPFIYGTSINIRVHIKIICAYVWDCLFGCHVKQWKCSEKYCQNVFFCRFCIYYGDAFFLILAIICLLHTSTQRNWVAFRYFFFSWLSFIRDGPFKHLRLLPHPHIHSFNHHLLRYIHSHSATFSLHTICYGILLVVLYTVCVCVFRRVYTCVITSPLTP